MAPTIDVPWALDVGNCFVKRYDILGIASSSIAVLVRVLNDENIDTTSYMMMFATTVHLDQASPYNWSYYYR